MLHSLLTARKHADSEDTDQTHIFAHFKSSTQPFKQKLISNIMKEHSVCDRVAN